MCNPEALAKELLIWQRNDLGPLPILGLGLLPTLVHVLVRLAFLRIQMCPS